MNRTLSQTPTKASVRRLLAEARRNLGAAEREERSRRICASCRSINGFSSADIVCSYINFREEVDTATFVDALLNEGRRIAVPVHVHGKGQPLLFAEIRSLTELLPNHFGILQPPVEEARFLPTAAIALFLVPGLAFDPVGRRLGYGLGFYDRAFAGAAPGAIKVGLAFEVQVLENVPADPHDVPMDIVVTEDRVIPAAAAGGAGTPTRRW